MPAYAYEDWNDGLSPVRTVGAFTSFTEYGKSGLYLCLLANEQVRADPFLTFDCDLI